MSNLPPQPGGWIDGSGNLQQGSPPPGFWQASDGRWYPPDLSSSSTQAAPSAYGPPSGPPGGGFQTGPSGYSPQGPGGYPGPHSSPGYSPPSSSSGGSKTSLYVGLGVVAAVLIAGLTAIMIINSGDDETTTGTTGGPAVSTPGVTTLGPGSTDATGGTTDTTAAAGGGGGELTATCTLLEGGEYAQVDMTNTGSEINSFYLTLIFRDDANTRVADDTAYIDYLRPGERTVEEVILLSGSGPVCEVAEIEESFPVDSAGVEAASGATCEVTGEDFAGDAAGTVSITNNGSERADLAAEVTLIGADGVRRGQATATVDAVEPGETAPGEIFSFVNYEEGMTCQVVYVASY